MRNLWTKCVYILILQYALLTVAYSNTMEINEQGDVFVETDRYMARFEDGTIILFHNKLTQETYTQGDFDAVRRLKVTDRHLWADFTDPTEIKRLSPIECEISYQKDYAIFHLFIGIDGKTGDLLIRQKGVSQNTGVQPIMWGIGNLSHSVVDVIAPVHGGQILTDSERYHYPGQWEAQLAILQGQRGGVFVRSDDTQYHFKTLEYFTEGDSFALNFWQIPPAPYDQQKQITSTTWRLNAYQGNWEVPALGYRQWMHEALQPVAHSEMPAWVNDIELIIIHSNVDPAILPRLNQLIDSEKTLIYMHQWRHGGHDKDLPNYAPDAVKPEFPDFVKEAHRYGFKVMPHVNMVGISTYHPLYTEFEKYQVINPWTKEKMGLNWEDATDPFRHAWINPASHSYRKMFVATLKNLWDTYQVDAFHLDISHFIANDNNGLIDGLTMAEGNILLHQELRDAIPDIVLGGESLNEITALHESFAQRWWIPPTQQPHPISSFLFSPYTKPYGYFIPNPDRRPEEYQKYLHEYEVWDILLTIRIIGAEDLEEQHRPETFKLFELARERQNWRFGDVNGDSVVNILDLTIIAQQIGTRKPSNRRVDVNGDGVVNILDLIVVAQQIG